MTDNGGRVSLVSTAHNAENELRGKLRKDILRPVCPKCHHPRLERLPRLGFLVKYVFSLIGLYPWTCGYCRSNMLLFKRNVSHKKNH
jgi:hypothetical protein